MMIADHGLLAESIAKTKAEDGWPYPTLGDERCSFIEDLGDYGSERCALVEGHDTYHYSGPGQVIWTAP